MTAAEFQKDPTRRDKLAALLKNPVLKEALEILQRQLEPNTQLAVTMASETVSNHRYHQAAGANHIVNGLKTLADPGQEAKPLPVKKLRTPKKDTP